MGGLTKGLHAHSSSPRPYRARNQRVLGGVEVGDGQRRPCQIALLAGADLIQTMSTPGVWSDKDLHHILGHYGAFIVERTGTDIDDALTNLQPWKDKIFVIQQLIHKDPVMPTKRDECAVSDPSAGD